MDGELPLSSSRLVVDHLDACVNCRTEAAALRAASAVVRELQSEASSGLGERIMSGARPARAGLDPSSWGMAWAWPRVAAMLVGAASMALVLSLATSESATKSVSPLVGEAQSNLHRLVHESQAELALNGSFGAELLALARRPEGRLISDLAGGR